MIPSATMASFFHHGSVHNESTILIMFVGVTALEPPICLSHLWTPTSALGPQHVPRGLLSDGNYCLGTYWILSTLEIRQGDSVSWLKFIFFRVFPFSFSFLLTTFFDCCFDSFRVWVLHPSPRISLSTFIWLRHMKAWGGC